MVGRLTLAIDGNFGLIRVTGSGMWSVDQAEEHFIAVERAVTETRRTRGGAVVLVDLREAAVQTAQTAAVIKAATSRIYKAADRVAIITSTQLLALQMKHAAQIEHLATFTDIDAALDWIGVAA